MTKTTVLPELRSQETRLVGPIIAAHNGGAITLPPEIVKHLTVAAALQDARQAADADAERAERSVPAIEEGIVAHLAAQGPAPAPSAPLRAAIAAHVALGQDAELLRSAAGRSAVAVRAAFLRHADAIAGDLAIALAGILADARPDAPLLEGFAFTDPTALHHARPEVKSAFGRLEVLATRHDLIRRAALALHTELHVNINDRARQAAAERFDILDFVGGGLVGPVRVRDGMPDFEWRPTGHPVARLRDAALAPEPEVEAQGETIEPELETIEVA